MASMVCPPEWRAEGPWSEMTKIQSTELRKRFCAARQRKLLHRWRAASTAGYIWGGDLLSHSMLLRKILEHTPIGRRSAEQLRVIGKWVLSTEFRRNRYVPNIFRGFSESDLDEFAQHVSLQRYNAEELIFLQTEEGSALYIILFGEVGIFDVPIPKIDIDLHRQFISHRLRQEMSRFAKEPISDPTHPARVLGAIVQKYTQVTSVYWGDSFGEISLLSENSLTTASIVTRKPCDILILPKAVFNRVVRPYYMSKFTFDKTLSFLRSCHLFSEWGESQYAIVAYWVELRRFTRGSTVFRQGDSSVRIAFVNSGAVKLVGRSRDGRDVDLSLVGPGGILGEGGVVVERYQMGYSIVCQSDVSLLTFNEPNFRRFVKYIGMLRELHKEREEFQRLRLELVESHLSQSLVELGERASKGGTGALFSPRASQKQRSLLPGVPPSKTSSPLRTKSSQGGGSVHFAGSTTVSSPPYMSMSAGSSGPQMGSKAARAGSAASSGVRSLLRPLPSLSQTGSFWRSGVSALSESIRPMASVGALRMISPVVSGAPSSSPMSKSTGSTPAVRAADDRYTRILAALNQDCTMREASILWSPSKTRYSHKAVTGGN